MKDNYLEITYRKGKALAAYIYLSRDTGIKSEYTRKIKEGIIVDFDKSNNAIGIEITAPLKITTPEINEILQGYHLSPISEQELAPLLKAA